MGRNYILRWGDCKLLPEFKVNHLYLYKNDTN